MAGVEEVEAQVRDRAAGGFVQRLAERVGASARASAVFGEPVEADGVTVIPVARATWGFGGGAGMREDGEEGSGGGGGGLVKPLGHIEVRGGHAEFKPLHDPVKLVALAAAAGLIAIVLRDLARR